MIIGFAENQATRKTSLVTSFLLTKRKLVIEKMYPPVINPLFRKTAKKRPALSAKTAYSPTPLFVYSSKKGEKKDLRKPFRKSKDPLQEKEKKKCKESVLSFLSLLRVGEGIWKRTFDCHIIIGMEKGKTDKLVSALVEKSKESAYLAVEIMNKPTIHYRTEGFCFFICNAWELLLKAFLIRERGSASIELPSKDGTPRTKSLSQCVDDVFTSTDNAAKSNLVLIVRMRNRATHLVASSDDKKYAPGFQTCVSNFFQFLKRHFPDQSSLDMTPFISLAVGTAEEREPVLIEPELSDFFQADGASFEPLLKGKLFITKKEADADFTAHIGKEGEHGLIKVEVPKDTKTTHPYTQTTAVKKIKELISANGLPPEMFNKYSFGRIKKDLALADNQTYCYKDTHYQTPLYYYSQATIDLIASRFVSDEEFRERYKARS